MFIRSIPILVSIFLCIHEHKPFAFVYYHTGGLYDTLASGSPYDSIFHPTGKAQWTAERYTKKLKDLARVLSSVPEQPKIIAFAGIENQQVLKDLFNLSPLNKYEWNFVTCKENSNQFADLALVFQKSFFQHYTAENILPEQFRTDIRGMPHIMRFTGFHGSDTLFIFLVNSQLPVNGMKEPDQKSVTMLRIACREFACRHPDVSVIVCGTMGTISEALLKPETKDPGNLRTDCNGVLCNLMTKNTVTYHTNGAWLPADHIIVSCNMLQYGNALTVQSGKALVLRYPWMLEYNAKAGDSIPWKTYGGYQYMGGISDHLPVYITIKGKRGCRLH